MNKMTNTFLNDSKVGDNPEEWEIVRLGDESIADLIMGQSPPSSTYNDKGIGLPFLQGNAEFGETYPAPILSCSQPIKIADKNDILLSVRAPVGDINIALSKSCIGRGLAAIRPKSDKLNYFFLYYYLKFGSRKFESLSMGSTFKAIRKEEVVKFQIPLPPLPEQRRIAEVLGTVDSAIQKVGGGAIEGTERLKKGLMQRLLTRGIGHERFKESEVGMVPEEWEAKTIGEIAKTSSGGTPSRDKKEYFIGSIPWVKSGELKDNTIYDTEETITEKGLQNSSAKLFPKGTLLIALYGATVGKTSILGIDATTNQAVCAILSKKDLIDQKFLQYFLISRRKQLISISAGGAQPNISQEIIRLFKIPLPPLSEQRRIAEMLSAVDRKLELERRRKEKLERVKKGLMNELLTGRKRVKVD